MLAKERPGYIDLKGVHVIAVYGKFKINLVCIKLI